MAIGEVSASGGLQSAPIQAAGADLQRNAIAGLGGAVEQLARAGFEWAGGQTAIAKVYDARAQGSIGLQLENQFLEYQRQRGEDYLNLTRDRSSSPLGLTNDFNTYLAGKEEEFLNTVPPRFREEYGNKLAADRAQRVSGAFSAELQLLDTQDETILNNSLNTLGTALKSGGTTLEDAQVSWAEMVNKSGLPPATKETLILGGRVTLQGLEFSSQLDLASRGFGAATTDTSGNDVVMANATPQQRAFLNALSHREAGSYDIWNGGQKFQGYTDHPANLGIITPGRSTAAGRYQFTQGTWNSTVADFEKRYGVQVPDFSPEWQDRMALHLARLEFNRRNGRGLDFDTALNSNDPEAWKLIRSTLGNPATDDPNSVVWEGWADRTFRGAGTEADQLFLELMSGDKGIAGGGTGQAPDVNVWTDPRFADVPLDQKTRFATSAAAASADFLQQQATEMAQAAKAFSDKVYNYAYTTGDSSGLEAFKLSPYWSAGVDKRMRAGLEEYNKNTSGIFAINGKLASNSILGSADMKAFNAWAGQSTFDGIASGDQSAYDKLQYGFTHGKALPTESTTYFRQAISNPVTRQKALEFLASVQMSNIDALAAAGFSEKDIADVSLFSWFAQHGDPTSAIRDYNTTKERLAMNPKSPGQVRDDAMKVWQESDYVGDIANVFDLGVQDAEPSLPTNPAISLQLERDGSEAFAYGFAQTGTEEGAWEYTKTVLQRIWGPTYVGTEKQLMRFPPEHSSFFPADAEGSRNYVTKNLQLWAEGVAPEGSGIDPSSANIFSDALTEQQVRKGLAPTYLVTATDETGAIIVLPGRWGGDGIAAQGEASIVHSAAAEAEAQRSPNVREKAWFDNKVAGIMQESAVTPTDTAAAQAVADKSAAEVAAAGPLEAPGMSEKFKMWLRDISDLSLPPSPEALASKKVWAVLQDDRFAEEQKAVRARTYDLIRKERKSDGSRYNEPTAQARARIEVVSRVTGMAPEEVAKVLDIEITW